MGTGEKRAAEPYEEKEKGNSTVSLGNKPHFSTANAVADHIDLSF